jgi:Bromodomain/Bromodomain extra-terminal - transcription regulation
LHGQEEQRYCSTFVPPPPMANEPSGELSDNNNGATSTIRDKNTFFSQKRSETTEETKKESKNQSLKGGTGETTEDGVEMDGTQPEEGAMGNDDTHTRYSEENTEDDEEDANDGDTAEESADDNDENANGDDDDAMDEDVEDENHDDDDDQEKNEDDEDQDGNDEDEAGKESESAVDTMREPGGHAGVKNSSTKSDGLNGNSKVSDAPNTSGGAAAGNAEAPSPPPPVLKGTLSYNVDMRRHVIRGMWNYENSNALPAQRFELVRTLAAHEDVKALPKDGEFHGSFSLAYFHTTSKGKQKERSKVIAESGVKIKFTRVEDEANDYKVDGQGTNQFGIFNINGTAKKSSDPDDPTYSIELRKRYAPSQVPATPAAGSALAGGDPKKNKKTKKRKHNLVGQPNGDLDDDYAMHEKEVGPLPPPSQSYPAQVICLRGKLTRDQSEDLGATEVMQRISGMWSSGLDLLLADPENVHGYCNRFEYEHKSTLPNKQWPVSGRYSGWFDLKNDDGTVTKMSERDVVLKFRKNNEGYHNVEGKGFNAFGKYNITGTLGADNVLTIFRHFQFKKLKNKEPGERPVTAIPPPLNAPGKAVKAPAVAPEPQLKLAQIVIAGEEPMKPTEQPEHGTYSAVSRGVLRVNEDGAHTCSGKWGMTRELYNNGQTSNFTFRLEPHFAAQSAADMKKANGETPDVTMEDSIDPTAVSLSAAPPGSSTFPVDSAMYKGSFQMKRGATKYTSVIDQQIILKFRKNTQGAYNVYGKGINSIGIFNLQGTLILSGKSSGHVELYRMYPLVTKPEATPVPGAQPGNAVGTGGKFSATNKPKLPTSSSRADLAKPITMGPPPSSGPLPAPASFLPGPPGAGLMRRESSRLVKLPSRLEDDDPQAQLARMMARCSEIIKFVIDKDASSGKFFLEPVDPVAHGIPTYYQIIKEPMDLGTIQIMIDNNDILTPEEFGRLVRLVFENAMTFNVEPTHVVHQAGRNLLILFNQKFRDLERNIEAIRKTHKMSDLEVQRLSTGNVSGIKDRGGKALVKKRKKEDLKSPKQQMLEEAQVMATSNAASMQAIVAAAPTGSGPVSRAEFKMMLQMIQRLQGQVVKTFTTVANMSSDEVEETLDPPTSVAEPMQMYAAPVPAPFESYMPPPTLSSATDKKKPGLKKKVEAKVDEIATEDVKPLTLKEQEVLTETINSLDRSKIPGIIQIIRESANLDDDEEEIDLEIEQLDTLTQRKLQSYVMKVRMVRWYFHIACWTRILNNFCIALCHPLLAARETTKEATKGKGSTEEKVASC